MKASRIILTGLLICLGFVTLKVVHFVSQLIGPRNLDAPYYSHVPSPSGHMEVVKQAGGEEYTYTKVFIKTDKGQNIPLPISDISPAESYYSDGTLFAWENDGHLIIASPEGHDLLHGPSQLEGIQLSYISYSLDLDRLNPKPDKMIRLSSPTIISEGKSYPGRFGNTGHGLLKQLTYSDCSLTLAGLDGSDFSKIVIDIAGHGEGKANDPDFLYPSYSPVNFYYRFLPKQGQISYALTPTQAEMTDLTSKSNFYGSNYRTLQYPGVLHDTAASPAEIDNVFKALMEGNLKVRVAFNFGKEVIIYSLSPPHEEVIKAIAAFKACTSSTNIIYPALKK